jgi:hypothetical protein
MPRTPSSICRLVQMLALAALVCAPGALRAQAVARQTIRTTVAVSVPGVIAIRAVGAPVVSARRALSVEVASSVVVQSNMRYRIVARVPASQRGVRVWVQNARGEFQRLDAATSVAVVERGTPGARSRNVVLYRLEADNAALLRSAAMALTYEASVELPTVQAEQLIAAAAE